MLTNTTTARMKCPNCPSLATLTTCIPSDRAMWVCPSCGWEEGAGVGTPYVPLRKEEARERAEKARKSGRTTNQVKSIARRTMDELLPRLA